MRSSLTKPGNKYTKKGNSLTQQLRNSLGRPLTVKFLTRAFAMALTANVLLAMVVAFLAFHKSESAKNHPPARKTYRLYQDMGQPVEERVKDLLSRMTLAEKIGQMTQTERSVTNHTNIRDFGIGSILSGGGSGPVENATVLQWGNMTNYFQKAAMNTRLAIPLIYGIDAVHGNNNIYGATIFPHNVGLGCTRDPELVERIGSATALECRATGIQYAFAPCIAVCRDPRWGRCYESYSEDPEIVRDMTSLIDGLQGRAPAGWDGPYVEDSDKVAACAKHFVGDGGTTRGLNGNNTQVSYRELVNIHMKAYKDAVRKGVATVMASYSSWNGVKMHANKFLLTRVLKKELGFKGFIISDYMGIDLITDPPGANYTYSVYAGIHAGLDMIMVPFAYEQFIGNLTQMVKSGAIPMSRINDAVTRILRVKFQMGLFESPYSDTKLVKTVGQESHRELSREAVRKSLVLLKNGKTPLTPLLPLNRNAKRILVTGSHASNIGLQCGGWTIKWQGKSGDITPGTTVLEGIQQAVSPDTEVVYAEKPGKGLFENLGFDYAIVVVGEPPYAETHGDNLNLTIPLNGPHAITHTCRRVRCVVVLMSGRPLVVAPLLHQMDALVAAWLPGTEAGLGIADVLFGSYDFTGKLARTWFRSVDQLPMNVGDKHYHPLFPFGYGLTMGLNNSRYIVLLVVLFLHM
ncbi:hypothetical protein KC19_1G087100 [Ceratodon purpureus]|uniref:beta-glucosidase n=1 Tax=Ceratodon purpureus TaxID=3225 RepID=A0A8T0J2Y5_CERPU|nr:hypothetical protein KC19_1G087100 [Ceratodon purpureus]